MARLHSLPAVLTGSLFVAAVAEPHILFDLPVTLAVELIVLALASPFAVLFVGQFVVTDNGWHRLYLALLGLPLLGIWQVCLFALLWLHGGLPVALLFGAAMSTVASAALGLCYLANKRPQKGRRPAVEVQV
jgi:hypothetical protein